MYELWANYSMLILIFSPAKQIGNFSLSISTEYN